MRILAVTSNYYHLLVVLQLKNTIFKNYTMDLVMLSNEDNNNTGSSVLSNKDNNDTGSSVLDSLHDIGLVNKYYSFKIPAATHNIIDNSKLVWHIAHNPEKLLDDHGIDVGEQYYDRFLICDAANLYVQCIYNVIRKMNLHMKCEFYESSPESYINLDYILFSHSYTQWTYALLDALMFHCRSLVSKHINNFYSFNPSSVQCSEHVTTVEIPSINTDDVAMLDTINNLFKNHEDELEVMYEFLEHTTEPHTYYPCETLVS